MARQRTASKPPAEPAAETPTDGGRPLFPYAGYIGVALAILGILLGLWLLARLQALVVMALISVVLASGLAPVVVWLEKLRLPRKKHISRTVAIFLVYILALTLALGAATLVTVPVVQQSIAFSQHLPGYLDSLEGWLADAHARYPQIPDYAGLVQRAQSQLSTAGQYVLSSAGAVFGFLGSAVSLFTVVVLTFYILATYERIHEGFISLVPRRSRRKTDEVLSKMAAAMGGWLRGMILLSGIIGLVSWGIASIAGVKYAAVIGVVGAVGELIPMVGPFAAAVPAVLLSLAGGPWKIAAVVIAFGTLALVEGNVLAPKIMEKQVGLTPLVTILALFAGASLLGVVGALLAIPVAAALQVLYGEVVAPAIREWGSRKS